MPNMGSARLNGPTAAVGAAASVDALSIGRHGGDYLGGVTSCHMLRCAWFLLFLPGCLAALAQTPTTWSRVRIHLQEPGHGIQQLAALGLPLDHCLPGPDGPMVELSALDVQRTRDAGFAVDVLIDDLTAHYQTANGHPPSGMRSIGWLCDGPTVRPDPLHFQTGSMAGYYTWEEMLAELDEMAALYPALISAKDTIGLSVEGRPLYFVRISNNPAVDQPDKPEVLYNAVHHAREPAAMSQLIYFMWYLLENYGSDPEVTALVDRRELWFVPCVNPDGYVYNQTVAPNGGGMWRKNRRDNGDGSFGVDLNRNYGWFWGNDDFGSSPFTGSEVYRGTGPFSEPETQAMRDLCNDHEFRAALNYHTYGNMVINPWGAQDQLTADSALYLAHGHELTRNNGLAVGTTTQVLYYNVNGTSDDWMYGDLSEKPAIQAVTPELGVADEGFWPPEWRILPICRENLDMNLIQAHLVGAYAVARDRTRPVFDQLAVDAAFEVQRLGLDTGSFSVAIEPLQHVASVAAPMTFTGLELLERRTDSIPIQLDPSITDGDPVRYVLALEQEGHVWRDTVERVFGGASVAFAEDGNSMAAWNSSDWGSTTAAWHSPPSSITDSPDGPYTSWGSQLVLYPPVDLSGAFTATLRFWARWDINRVRDFTQVSASADGFSWTPLCGIYTRPGSSFQGNGEPVYDGQQWEWVQEEMDLDPYVGGNLQLRFRMGSTLDNGWGDGFYFDDLEVVTTGSPVGITGSMGARPEAMRFQPSPAHGSTVLVLPQAPAVGSHLSIHDATGRIVLGLQLAGRITPMDLSGLDAGLYYGVLRHPAGTTRTATLVLE
jgi:carboxypeptidase T